MIPRPLGQTGVSVHPVGLGCMSLSGFYGETTEAEALRLLAATLDLGVDFWDTANVYGEGLSETRLAKFFAQRPAQRARVTLATKFAISRDADGKRFIDNSPAHMIAALDGSLKRLGVDRVDLYYVHRLDPRFPIEDTVGELSRQVERGKIGAIGLSETAPDTLRRAHAVHPIAAVQSEYSLWTRGPELGMLQTCAELRVSFVAFSPVGRGALGGDGARPRRLAGGGFSQEQSALYGSQLAAQPRAHRRLRRARAQLRARPRRTGPRLGSGPGTAHILAIPGTRYRANSCAIRRPRRQPAADARPRRRASPACLPVGWAAGDRYTEAQWSNIERYC